MKLVDLLRSAGLDPAQAQLASPNVEITAVHNDSRRVVPGTLFVARDGLSVRGLDFLPSAIASGAVAAVVAEDAVIDPELAQQTVLVRVPDPRRVAGPLASALAGHPSRKMRVLAITGTNGKTTTATLTAQLLCAAGRKAAALGTLGLWTADGIESGGLTTPDAVDLQLRLAALAARGFEVVVLEASSHALDQGRLLGTHISGAAWTNLSRDHLDYHGDLQSYAAAKTRLFSELLPTSSPAWVNADDAHARAVAGTDNIRAYSFGADPTAQAQVAGLQMDQHGLRLRLHIGADVMALHASLLGRHNAHNLVVAALFARDLGLKVDEITKACQSLTAPRGRLEPVANRLGALILVDYAHTPDALSQVLAMGRELTAAEGKLVVVFGCGGDRDKGKRAPMGAAAGAADIAFATSDNPRTESPDAILIPVAQGLASTGARQLTRLVPSTLARAPGEHLYCVDADRADAIRRAIGVLSPGDVLIIAGKGHETTQTIGTEVRPFDDAAIARRWCAQRRPAEVATAYSVDGLSDFSFDGARAAAATGGQSSGGAATTTTLTTDSRHISPGALFVALVGERFDGHSYLQKAVELGAAGLICEQGRADERLAHGDTWVCETADTLVALGDLALAHRRQFRGPVVCITGSNGKTTTKELTALALGAAGHVLRTFKNHNNRIGVPQTLARLRADHDYAVVECGMSIPGEITELGRIAEPDVAVITNVAAAHLEGLGSIEGVAAEKTDLLRRLRPGGTAIVPAGDALIAPHLAELPGTILTVGIAAPADVHVVGDVQVDALSQRFVASVCGLQVPVTLPAIGVHMVHNALTALAIASATGVNVVAAARALARFEPVGQRMRPMPLGDRLVLEDCYNANPASVRVALQSLTGLAGPHAAVLGDMLELGPQAAALHAQAGADAADLGVQLLLARGQFAADTVRGARQAGLEAAFAFTGDTDAAAKVLASGARTILVKGSRGARMETVIAALSAAAAPHSSTASPTAGPGPSNDGATIALEEDRVSVAL
ncbi:MAG: UDP-N-acetylmuramoyl-L-alanyl-D-glutamate--2,6-diaminopimelate ligase [Myxococcales bacterium]|nr:UDP-N-acetylmuramoyl-L-alanyl-D-glutamate--2,6-diaminopimelate ligase [Myxococcales bacterium]